MNATAPEVVRTRPTEGHLDATKTIENRGKPYTVEPGPVTSWSVDQFGNKSNPTEKQGVIARTKEFIGRDIAITQEKYAMGPDIIKAIEASDLNALSEETRKLVNDPVTGLSNLCAIMLCHGKITPEQYALLVNKHGKSSVSNPEGYLKAMSDGVTGAADHMRMVRAAMSLPEGWHIAHNNTQPTEKFAMTVTNITPDGIIEVQNKTNFFAAQYKYQPGKGFLPTPVANVFNFSAN